MIIMPDRNHLYALGIGIFLNPYAWLFPILIIMGGSHFQWTMLYQVLISIIGFTLLAYLLKNDVEELSLDLDGSLKRSAEYVALSWITPIFEWLFILTIGPGHDPTALALFYGIPIGLAVLTPVYVFLLTWLGMRWAGFRKINS